VRALALLVLIGGGCAGPKLDFKPSANLTPDAGQEPCGLGGVEVDDCYEQAPVDHGGPCDVECRNGKLCLVRPAACKNAPIIVGPTEYLAPK
jgi:hypothetical protein